MANNGRHTNGSQFYITLQPAPWMDKKYVALGWLNKSWDSQLFNQIKYIYILSQVVEGYETLAKLEAINTQNQRPLKECKIVECGSYKFEF